MLYIKFALTRNYWYLVYVDDVKCINQDCIFENFAKVKHSRFFPSFKDIFRRSIGK